MNTIQVKVTYNDEYNDDDFLILINVGGEGLKSLTSKETDILLDVFSRYPDIFKKPIKRPYGSDEVTLIDPADESKYAYPLSFDLTHMYSDLTKEDQEKLQELSGTVGGISQKYTAEKK